MGKKKLQPVHPGEVLLEEFLKPMGLSQNRVANKWSRGSNLHCSINDFSFNTSISF